MLRDPSLNKLKIALKEGSNSLNNVATFIFNNSSNRENQLINLVDAASINYGNDLSPLLSARYHIFLKAAEGAYLTLFQEKKVYLKPLNATTFNSIKEDKKDDPVIAFEFGTCKYCGSVFLIGKIEKNGAEKKFLQNITPESEVGKNQKNVYLSLCQDIPEDPGNEDDITQLEVKKSFD